MNNKHQKNVVLTEPLVFTVPAYGFVVALYLIDSAQPNGSFFGERDT